MIDIFYFISTCFTFCSIMIPFIMLIQVYRKRKELRHSKLRVVGIIIFYEAVLIYDFLKWILKRKQVGIIKNER